MIPHEDTPPPAARQLGPIVRPIEIATIAGIIVVDQVTKFAVRSTIPLYAKRSIIPNLLDFTHVQNTGAAFGVLNAADFPFKSIVMIVVAALALVEISLYARQLGHGRRRYGGDILGRRSASIDRAISYRELRGHLLGQRPLLGVQHRETRRSQPARFSSCRDDRHRPAPCIPSCLISGHSLYACGPARGHPCSGLRFALTQARARGLDRQHDGPQHLDHRQRARGHKLAPRPTSGSTQVRALLDRPLSGRVLTA